MDLRIEMFSGNDRMVCNGRIFTCRTAACNTFAAWLTGVQRYIKMIILKIPPGHIRENRKLIETDDFITHALIFACFKIKGSRMPDPG